LEEVPDTIYSARRSSSGSSSYANSKSSSNGIGDEPSSELPSSSSSEPVKKQSVHLYADYGNRRQFLAAEELLSLQICETNDDLSDCLKNAVKEYKKDWNPDDVFSVEEFWNDEPLNSRLMEKRLSEGERSVIQLFVQEAALLEQLLDAVLSVGGVPVSYDEKPEGDSLRPKRIQRPIIKGCMLRVIATLISALRKLRVYIADLNGYTLITTVAGLDSGDCEFLCLSRFLKGSLVKEIDPAKHHDFIIPFRGMVSCIPTETPVIVMEPGSMFHKCGNHLWQEAPWEKVGFFKSVLPCEWFFPVHHVFCRSGYPPCRREKEEAKLHCCREQEEAKRP